MIPYQIQCNNYFGKDGLLKKLASYHYYLLIVIPTNLILTMLPHCTTVPIHSYRCTCSTFDTLRLNSLHGSPHTN